MTAQLIELKPPRRSGDPVARKRTLWAWALATFFGTGMLKPGPGTWASAFTVALVWLWTRSLTPGHAEIAIAAACILVTAIGIPAATIVEREFGKTDPGLVVIDEVAGQLIPLILIPSPGVPSLGPSGSLLDWKYLLASLILFRCFDIVKPPPLRWLERLPGGVGIMLDDLGAGVYALAIVAVTKHFHLF